MCVEILLQVSNGVYLHQWKAKRYYLLNPTIITVKHRITEDNQFLHLTYFILVNILTSFLNDIIFIYFQYKYFHKIWIIILFATI